jgi:serine-type D-Ala-D-Ala carboxypeptidase/endopeptidase (penicillin-binding protein 4)
MLKRLLLLAFLLLAAPALAQQQAVETALETAPKGTRFGLLVVDEQGREVAAIASDQRFIPASNTKLFTTAAAYALLPGIDQPDAAGGTQMRLEPGKRRAVPDVRLIGRGDARMSSARDCKVNCLAELADAVATMTRQVHDVVGDDRFWPDQRWSPGMSWNNIGTDNGTAVSALNLDDNEVPVTVKPGLPGQQPQVTVSPYFTLHNEALTIEPGGKLTLALERPVNGMTLRLHGEIPADAKDWRERVGIDDPAHFAAWTFRRMLEARGVKVTGKVRVRHRVADRFDDPKWEPGSPFPFAHGGGPFASLVPLPLADDVVTINKLSQNLRAQALFRRMGELGRTGSEEWAAQSLKNLLERANIPRHGYDFSDGSGMSTYNRLSPRATVALLRWAATQPWGEAWYASLPIAGVDGTLKRRFIGTPLAGNLSAKTGTLNATNALSGRFRAKSGRMLTFSFFANDVPDGTSPIPAMEAALLAIYAAN